MIQKASYLLPGIVKYKILTQIQMQIHWNNRNGLGSPKGDWGQAQAAFTTSWLMFECYFFTSRTHSVFCSLCYPYPLRWYLQTGEENGECKRFIFPISAFVWTDTSMTWLSARQWIPAWGLYKDLISVGFMLQCPEPAPSLARESPVPMGSL